ncbi:ABC transporter transmembrane domain-containing protein [Bartonella tamiae]|uniref:ABC transporter, permease/ATP-binding protein n=1 Tax=Bartonella tamiae Th239 TaxID=1094558 RepID=J1K3M8_9HYPH|nr:ABC transporter transmembrane domain-containing protein [Bartonella tamiae]EJF91750.1 ABC transporter, permease/ATP-binding protein [Bartonella tamiae Th239]EJF92582.1 ABC transporter, permease/ATP-binding protein [Bartonella tamiae Th307]
MDSQTDAKNTENKTIKRKKSNLRPLSTLLPYLLRYKKLAIAAAVSLIVAALVMLVLPIAIRRMLDHGFSYGDGTMINSYFGVLFLLAAILALASAGRYYSVITLGENVVADLRRDVFHHITTLSPEFFDRSHSGEIISRLSADTTQIKSAVGATASVSLRNMIMAVGAIIMMTVTSPKLSAMVLVAIPIIVIPIIVFGRKVRLRTRLAQDRLADATALASEQVSAIRTIQAFTAEKEINKRFSLLVYRAFQAAKGSILSRAFLTGFAIFLVFSSVVAVLWIGSNDVLHNTMTPGTLGQFVLYAVFGASAFGQLSEVGAELAQASGAAERLAEILVEKSDVIKPSTPLKMPHPAKGAVQFDHVDFAYPTRLTQPALKNFSFSVKAGEKIAFVGPSGAGKSTIFSLILRFYDPQKGIISFDGIDVTKADPHDLRMRIAYVPQDVAIFNGTLRENIAFGCENADDRQIEAAAKAANATDFIFALKDGFETQVGERGITLSGGQKQRIAIARALLRDAPLLLLDEATSALDAESEMLVQKSLERLMEGRTTLVIAHRLATILKADRILVIDGGIIVEQGTHDELVAKNGLYARLAKLQFSH